MTLKKNYIKYLVSLLLFGSNGVIASYISLNSYEIVLLRCFFGCIMLAVLFIVSGKRPTFMKYKKDSLFIVLSGVAMAANWLFLFEAYDRIGVSLGMIIDYTGPVIVMALSPFVFGEKLTWRKLAALAAALTGVILIGGTAFGEFSFSGLLYAVMSAVFLALVIILNKKSETVTGVENSLLQLFTTFIVVAVFVGIKQGFKMEISSDEWLPILWLGVVNTGLGCYFYFSSIGGLPAQTVAVCGYLEPLSAAVFAAAVLGETMMPLQYLGAALIIGGALFGEGIFKRKKAAANLSFEKDTR